ncbi:AAA family ATPase [Sphingomonas sp. NIC1]|uniref:AAA family ATPase n=1 Tax=Sphingomonas sp. NIC1 TaxID=1961362 RepID=UPI000997D5AE|nr:ATP-binding protein [Sphingomonas sp. NIC1]
MITKLEIENFYSIKNKHVLDFTVPATTPQSDKYRFAIDGYKARTPTVLAIFGANASGKTSVLRAASFIRHFVIQSFDTYKPDQMIGIQAFACHGHYTAPSTIAMEFTTSEGFEIFGNSAARYEVSISSERGKSVVEHEALLTIDASGNARRIFSRTFRNGESKITTAKDFGLAASDPRRNVRDNVSLLSSLVQFNHGPSVKIIEAFRQSFFYNIDIGKVQNTEANVTKFLEGSPAFLKLLNSVIRRIDLGITKVEIRNDGDGILIPVFYHSGLDYPRTFHFESQGTQSFYLNFMDIFAALTMGGVAIMDELDADLHPNLMAEVIEWFHSEVENPLGAQLFLTCHNASIISDLDKEEVWLAEKNDFGETTVRGIKDFRGIRRDANLYSKYMAGEFGGVPRFG